MTNFVWPIAHAAMA